MVESRKRSAVKAITYRIIGVIVTTGVAFVFTREIGLSLSIGSLDMILKFFCYYSHERIWDKMGYGREMIEYNI